MGLSTNPDTRRAGPESWCAHGVHTSSIVLTIAKYGVPPYGRFRPLGQPSMYQ